MVGSYDKLRSRVVRATDRGAQVAPDPDCGGPRAKDSMRRLGKMSNDMSFEFDAVDFVTSDTHFGHARIIELAHRPFVDVDEMVEEMVRRWNAVVAPGDVVLHLGDVALGPISLSLQITERLNGRRLLIPGNHDRVSPATQTKNGVARFTPVYEAAGWEILPEIVSGTRRGRRLLASHYPYVGDSTSTERHRSHRPVDIDGTPLIHGHTHDSHRGEDGIQFHVGVDAHDFAPIPFTRIDEWLAQLPDANREVSVTVSVLVAELRAVRGAKLVASSAGVADTRTVRDWIDGVRRPSIESAARLRLAHDVVAVLRRAEPDSVISTWFQGLNPLLDETSPARVLREEPLGDVKRCVLAAARAFDAS